MRKLIIFFVCYQSFIACMAYSDSTNIRISGNYGKGFRQGIISTGNVELNDYIKKMNNSKIFSFDFSYFYQFIGGGLYFSNFTADGRDDDFLLIDEHGNKIGNGIIDRVDYSFLGAGLFLRQSVLSNNMIKVMGFVTPGMFFYKQYSYRAGQEFELISRPTGVQFGFAVDFMINKYIGVGINYSFLSGAIKKAEINDVQITKPEPESLNRMDISLGIRICR